MREPGTVRKPPLYARVLRLRHIYPGALLCSVFFEGTVGLAILFSLADLVNWWGVILLPAVVAGFVKINDIIAGAFAGTDKRGGSRRRPAARGVAHVMMRRSAPAARRDPDTNFGGYQEDDGTDTVIIDRTATLREGESWADARQRRAKNQRGFAPASGSRTADQQTPDR